MARVRGMYCEGTVFKKLPSSIYCPSIHRNNHHSKYTPHANIDLKTSICSMTDDSLVPPLADRISTLFV